MMVMKTIYAISALAMFIVSPFEARAQLRKDEPTVRYEARPVEDIVRNGAPVNNYDGNDRIIVTERDKALQRQQWQERQQREDAERARQRREHYERRGRHLRGYDPREYVAYPPMLNRYTWVTREPWRYNLPDRGPRYVWAKIGWDAVLYDLNTQYPVYIWNNWFR